MSESQLLKWERQGWLTPIKYPGIRAVGYDPAEVRALAERIIQSARNPQPSDLATA